MFSRQLLLRLCRAQTEFHRDNHDVLRFGRHPAKRRIKEGLRAIDGLVEQENLDRLSFIKMDIEGAELDALKGAEASIRRFRPKLAISLYHSLSDFHTIPAWIESLDLGYRFHLKHATIHAEETVLFARPS